MVKAIIKGETKYFDDVAMARYIISQYYGVNQLSLAEYEAALASIEEVNEKEVKKDE